jgi:hypothetical protein
MGDFVLLLLLLLMMMCVMAGAWKLYGACSMGGVGPVCGGS